MTGSCMRCRVWRNVSKPKYIFIPGNRNGLSTNGIPSRMEPKLLFMPISRGKIPVRKKWKSMSAGTALCHLKIISTISPSVDLWSIRQPLPGHRLPPIRMAWSVPTGQKAGSSRIARSATVNAAASPSGNIMMPGMIIILPISMLKVLHRWREMLSAEDSIMAGQKKISVVILSADVISITASRPVSLEEWVVYSQ